MNWGYWVNRVFENLTTKVWYYFIKKILNSKNHDLMLDNFLSLHVWQWFGSNLGEMKKILFWNSDTYLLGGWVRFKYIIRHSRQHLWLHMVLVSRFLYKHHLGTLKQTRQQRVKIYFPKSCHGIVNYSLLKSFLALILFVCCDWIWENGVISFQPNVMSCLLRKQSFRRTRYECTLV